MNEQMNADYSAKGKFNKKLLAIAITIIVAIAVVFSWRIYENSSGVTKSGVILPTLRLTLIGANGQQKVLSANELAALKSYTSYGGYSGEGVTYVGNFTGVPILTLLGLVGGITTGENVTVMGSDGYQVTFTYQQVQGQGINTFDPTGAAVQPSQPLTVIAAYYCNSTSITSGKGPLTIAIVGPQGLYTNGDWWVYLLMKIEIIPA
jgi:DMSO/TMAO reductase YedYZ molybdopterin-dependent catalytic subunit